jgi:hypothetical protein
MQLLNILASGGLFWGLTAVYVALSVWFLYQTFKARKSGWRQDAVNVKREGTEKIPLLRIGAFKFFLAITAAYIIALLIVASDYRGVEP